ncbi:MAG: DUF1501 domain-containing protein [Pirellulales bacterium]|nr:DUF1501 domain-containing protein [Pirellulales bacterium]
MLSFSDRASRTRVSGRREFLQIGGLSLGAAALANVSRAVASPGGLSPLTGKSVIVLFQQGGPPQHETFDPKVNAPSAVASVGGEIATSIPGVRFGASMKKLARLADRIAVVRNYQTGTQHGGMKPIVNPETGDACLGAVYSRVAGTNHPTTGLPTSMALWPISADAKQPGPRDRFGNLSTTGSLSSAYTPFTPGGDGPLHQAMQLAIERNRIEDRRSLLSQLDNLHRQLDATGQIAGTDGMQAQAMRLILKDVAEAFDLSKEDPRTLARYDTSAYYNPALWQKNGKAKNNKTSYTAHTKTLGKLLLLARRLCEAGCGMITINTEFVWDFHSDGNNVAVPEGKKLVIEPFDHAVSAFIEDCEARGLSDKILLVCCGEMGRTPKINAKGGRDHWPKLGPLMLYGGGITDGQVVGKSTRDGGESVDTPLLPVNVASTILHTLFDFGQVRLIPDLPAELRRGFEQIEKTPGVI